MIYSTRFGDYFLSIKKISIFLVLKYQISYYIYQKWERKPRPLGVYSENCVYSKKLTDKPVITGFFVLT